MLSLGLAIVMAICLIVTFVFGTMAIATYGSPFGATVMFIAQAAAWLFAAAFLATFFFVLVEELNKDPSERAARSTSSH
jgi:hypothetical protein